MASINIEPGDTSITVGQPQIFTVTGTLSDGSPAPQALLLPLVCSPVNPLVAIPAVAVGAGNVYTGAGEGVVFIAASIPKSLPAPAIRGPSKSP